MAYILDIATAVPEFSVSKEELAKFYSKALESIGEKCNEKKITFLNEKTEIEKRYSCISDFNGAEYELFNEGNYNQPVEKRTHLYKQKIMPLAIKAIDQLLDTTKVKTKDISHIITVSCTGMFAPGMEFLVSEHYGLQHTEKLAINFLGCYAALKALKHAHYIAKANPDACILIISAELCSLHFHPSISDEDIIANLLFADGAAATMVCGEKSKYIKNKIVLNTDSIGSAYIPNTMDLMTWNVSSTAFRMYLSKQVVNAIKENIKPVVHDFLADSETDYWAIHPGGPRIVQAIEESLNLTKENVEDSIHTLQQYGNMSSPTILFILKKILDKIKSTEPSKNKKVVACAFGPGLSIEMIRFSSVLISQPTKIKHFIEDHAI